MNIYFYWYFSFLWYIFLYFLAYSVPLPFIFIETTNHLQDSSSYSWLLVFFRLLFIRFLHLQSHAFPGDVDGVS